MRKLALCILLAAAMGFAADVSGTWKGNAFRQDGTPSMDIVLMVKQAQEKVSGTVGPSPDEQVPISNAKVDGEKFDFEVITDNGTYKVKMLVDGEGMKGNAVRTLDGQDSPPMKIELKRSK